MKTNLLKLGTSTLLAASVILSLTACGDVAKQLGLKKDAQTEKVTITVSDQMDAEQLAQAAEQLIGPYTFMLADKAAEMALAKDPANQRALFYRSFLKRFMSLKGILTRVKPLVRTQGNITEFERWTSQLPYSPMRDFLFDGAEDIRDVKTAQDFLVQYRESINSFRKYLRSNPDINITLNMNPHVWQQALSDSVTDNCTIKKIETPNGVRYEASCDYREIVQRKINPADALAISQAAAGEVLYYSILTSYSYEGTDALLKVDFTNATSSERQAAFEKIPTFGLLRADQGMSEIRNLGADFVGAVKWAISKQSQLCPTGTETKAARRGFIFSKGICVNTDSESQRTLALIETALNSAIQVKIKNAHDEEVTANVDYLALSRKPVVDIRTILPASFDNCGNATSLRDKTMGGTFPDGNAETFMVGKSCNK